MKIKRIDDRLTGCGALWWLNLVTQQQLVDMKLKLVDVLLNRNKVF